MGRGRADGRKANELRRVDIIRHYTCYAPGSVLISTGTTRVLCTASIERGVPEWRREQGSSGWLTAEYGMLPSSTPQRRSRQDGRPDGRCQEIQRLIGRALRAVIDLDRLGEMTVRIDCDVLQADGGTRTASITGAYIALADAITDALRKGMLSGTPMIDSVAAVSVGLVGGRVLLDLDYSEDSTAEVDFNVVKTGKGKFVEVQGSAERAPFDDHQLDQVLKLADRGIRQLLRSQQMSLRSG
jgi:ribonuclease PH